MTEYKKIEKKIKTKEDQLKYIKKRNKVCGWSKRSEYEEIELEQEIAELKERLEELENE